MAARRLIVVAVVVLVATTEACGASSGTAHAEKPNLAAWCARYRSFVGPGGQLRLEPQKTLKDYQALASGAPAAVSHPLDDIAFWARNSLAYRNYYQARHQDNTTVLADDLVRVTQYAGANCTPV